MVGTEIDGASNRRNALNPPRNVEFSRRHSASALGAGRGIRTLVCALIAADALIGIAVARADSHRIACPGESEQTLTATARSCRVGSVEDSL